MYLYTHSFKNTKKNHEQLFFNIKNIHYFVSTKTSKPMAGALRGVSRGHPQGPAAALPGRRRLRRLRGGLGAEGLFGAAEVADGVAGGWWWGGVLGLSF